MLHCMMAVLLGMFVGNFLIPVYLGAILTGWKQYVIGFAFVLLNAAVLAFLAPHTLDGVQVFHGLASTAYWSNFPAEVGTAMAGSRIVGFFAGIVLGMAWRQGEDTRVALAASIAALAIVYGAHRIEQAPLERARIVVGIDETKAEYQKRFDAAIRELKSSSPTLDPALADRVAAKYGLAVPKAVD
jgi:hypothetical protein